MSKESYIRGFCKAAEACGVDPQALAKYAAESSPATVSKPKYDTKGYAPGSVAAIGTSAVPLYYPPYYDYTSPSEQALKIYKDSNTAYPMQWPSQASRLARKLRGDNLDSYADNPPVLARAKAKPEYMAWLLAHNKAMDAVDNASKDVQFPDGRIAQDEELNKMLAELYHKTMAQQTGAVSRVSAPVATAPSKK